MYLLSINIQQLTFIGAFISEVWDVHGLLNLVSNSIKQQKINFDS